MPQVQRTVSKLSTGTADKSVMCSSNPYTLPVVPLITWIANSELHQSLFHKGLHTYHRCIQIFEPSNVECEDEIFAYLVAAAFFAPSFGFASTFSKWEIQIFTSSSGRKAFSASSDTFVDSLKACWIIADGGLVIGIANDDTAAWGCTKCPLQNPEHCLHFLLPHWHSGSNTGMGRCVSGGPSGNHEKLLRGIPTYLWHSGWMHPGLKQHNK